MADTFDVKLLRRSLAERKRDTSVKTLYADRSFVDQLDIINELGGHTGCVNALRCVEQGSCPFPPISEQLLISSAGRGAANSSPQAPMTHI